MKRLKISKKAVIIASIIAIISIGLIVVMIFTGDIRKIRKNLDLGYRYLQELKYEEAIASFQRVIDINPMESVAYIGIADAYIGMEKFDEACDILEKGIDFFEEREDSDSAQILKNKMIEIDKIVPFVSIQGILDGLNDLWGKSWLEWTIEDFIDEMNLVDDYGDGFYEYRIDSETFYYADVPNGEFYESFGIAKEWPVGGGGVNSEGVNGFSFQDNGNTRCYGHCLKSDKYEVIKDSLWLFYNEKGIDSLETAGQYFHAEDSWRIRTELGIAVVGYSAGGLLRIEHFSKDPRFSITFQNDACFAETFGVGYFYDESFRY